MKLNTQGHSLPEIMISLLIFMAIAAALFFTLMAGHVSWQNHNASVEVQAEARKAIMYLTRDLRQAENIIINPGAGTLSVSFFQPGIGNVSYSWTNSGTNANRIIRVRQTGSRIIARDIASFSVTNGTEDISISLTAAISNEKGEIDSFPLDAKVDKR